MKNFVTAFVLLMISFPLFSEEIFFECTPTDEKGETVLKISFDEDMNTGTIDVSVADFILSVDRIQKTIDEVILDACIISTVCTKWIINRSTLKLTGNREGQCRIVEKKNIF